MLELKIKTHKKNKIKSNQYIKAIQGNLEMFPLHQMPVIKRLKLDALFINGKNESLFIDGDLCDRDRYACLIVYAYKCFSAFCEFP